jgi:DNA-binding response OmpR family regulator
MKTILAVDDEPDILALVEKILKREGYEVITASNGANAIAMLKTGKKIDLILLDVMMPNINGFEVSQWMRGSESEKRIPVVFVTAKDDAQSMKEGFRSGGTVYLTKPFTTTQLVRTVTSVIGK